MPFYFYEQNMPFLMCIIMAWDDFFHASLRVPWVQRMGKKYHFIIKSISKLYRTSMMCCVTCGFSGKLFHYLTLLLKHVPFEILGFSRICILELYFL